MCLYDTTFNLCNYFISPLLIRFSYFESEPCIPIAFFIHERKTKISHAEFFKEIREIMPMLSEKAFICTDHEDAFIKALREELPGVTQVRCWNHVFKNVRNWISSHKGHKHDQVFYTTQLKSLFQCPNENEYNKLFDELKANWDKAFIDYYTTNIHSQINDIGRWTLEKLGCYNPYSGITTNGGEGRLIF